MTYNEAVKRIEFLNKKIPNWTRWPVQVTWNKIIRWSDSLGYKG